MAPPAEDASKSAGQINFLLDLPSIISQPKLPSLPPGSVQMKRQISEPMVDRPVTTAANMEDDTFVRYGNWVGLYSPIVSN
ncbi:hypothetical protein BJY01DRAFT_222441 [Aspergillus pseudoustus]|uniref:Uncharacterized protein n=1 Tax=Aspergillus pseudoustus TaxID=1810923 RepID=A0ABR4J7Y4_9EURO